jgi:hypothetical protein
MNESDNKKLDDLLERFDKMKADNKADLSSDEDLSIAVMNLVSIEEHLFFTGAKLDQPQYYDLLAEVREMRKQLMKKLVKDPEGEVWCISKHLLAASMRVMEVGTKALGAGRKDEARELFEKAYGVYALFWGLNLGVVKAEGVKAIDEQAINHHDTEKKGFVGKLGDLVRKAIDCCIE